MAKKKSSTKKSRVHVISRDKGWAVKREGASRATKIYKKKGTAVKRAEKSAKKRGGDVVVHKRDGSIHKWIKK